jgi:hypothetical protein
MAPISLKTTSSVNPIILNGRRISHINGSKKIKASAKGQHITNKMNHKKTAIIVFIEKFPRNFTNNEPISKHDNLAYLKSFVVG